MWSCTPPSGSLPAAPQGSREDGCAVPMVVYQNTLANAVPRAMARLRITLALWVRLEASNARSLRSLSSNGTPDHRVLDAPDDQVPQQSHPLPLDLACRRGLQVRVRGIGVAHSAAD